MNLKELKSKYNLSALELFTQDSSTCKISFTANKLKQTESIYSKGFAVRVIKNNKIGFTSNYCNNNNIDEMINQALEILEFSEEIKFNLPGKRKTNHQIKNDSKPMNKEILKGFKERGSLIIESILKEAPEALIDMSFDLQEVNECLENSNKLHCSYSNRLYSYSINIRETLENNFIDIFTAQVDETINALEKLSNEVTRLYKLTKKHAKINSGQCPVLFTSKASKELFNTIEMALNGKQINQKASPWHNKLGKQVLSTSITIQQDPSFGYMAREIDDEGSIVKPIILINKGILENFYYDLLSASKSNNNFLSTGNGFKSSLSTQPEPTLLNMITSLGKRSLDEIIKNIDYGLLVDQTMGGLTTNISGDLSVNVDIGFLIEKGEITGRIKDTMVSGNIYNAFNNIIELSNSPKWYWSNIYSPDILLDGFTVTARS